MSVYEDRREELEKYEFQMGLPRGRLAMTMDLLTDALVLVGPAMDIQLITKGINDAKDLIRDVMSELKPKQAP
jgi:hypothetical protein